MCILIELLIICLVQHKIIKVNPPCIYIILLKISYSNTDFLFSVGWTVGQQHDWQATLDENREGTFFSHQPTTTTADEVISFL